jgi:hypothetical protein
MNIPDTKIHSLVSKACVTLNATNGALGSNVSLMANGSTVKTTLTGFRADRERMVVEVQIDDTIVDRVCVKQVDSGYSHIANPTHRYGYLYKLKTGSATQ